MVVIGQTSVHEPAPADMDKSGSLSAGADSPDEFEDANSGMELESAQFTDNDGLNFAIKSTSTDNSSFFLLSLGPRNQNRPSK